MLKPCKVIKGQSPSIEEKWPAITSRFSDWYKLYNIFNASVTSLLIELITKNKNKLCPVKNFEKLLTFYVTYIACICKSFLCNSISCKTVWFLTSQRSCFSMKLWCAQNIFFVGIRTEQGLLLARLKTLTKSYVPKHFSLCL